MRSTRAAVAVVLAGLGFSAVAVGLYALLASPGGLAPPERTGSPAASPAAALPGSPTRPPPLGTPEELAARPNFLVIDIDTLSIGHVGTLRDGEPVTPTIDALAADGVRFTHLVSQSGWTLPALYSSLTGALPVPLTVWHDAIPWSEEGVRDLPEILGIYGYSSAIFFGITLPGQVSDERFSHFDFVSAKTDAPPTEALREWLRDAPEPFFVYAHEVDLHDPLAMTAASAAPPYDTIWPAAARDYGVAYAELSGRVGEAEARAATLAHYDGVLHLYDAALASVIGTLVDRGVADRTVVVVLSDHGEDFFHHAVVDHGRLYDTTLRVPLVIRDPAGTVHGQTVDSLVQTVDVAPTILSRAGIPLAVSMVGRSLGPFWGQPGEKYVERPVYSMSSACQASLRTTNHKIIVSGTGAFGARSATSPEAAPPVPLEEFAHAHAITEPLPDCSTLKPPTHPGGPSPEHGPGPGALRLEFFDLVADPDERENRILAEPDAALPMLRALLLTMAQRRRALDGAPAETLRPEQIQQMKDQGYWGMVLPRPDRAEPP